MHTRKICVCDMCVLLTHAVLPGSDAWLPWGVLLCASRRVERDGQELRADGSCGVVEDVIGPHPARLINVLRHTLGPGSAPSLVNASRVFTVRLRMFVHWGLDTARSVTGLRASRVQNFFWWVSVGGPTLPGPPRSWMAVRARPPLAFLTRRRQGVGAFSVSVRLCVWLFCLSCACNSSKPKLVSSSH